MRKYRLLAVALAVLVPPTVVLPTLSSSAGAPASPATAAAAAAAAPPSTTRIAFTDERDQLYSRDVELNTSTGSVLPPTGSLPSSYRNEEIGDSDDPVHVGEYADGFGGAEAFVSTQDSEEGEVYARPGDSSLFRVTCDPGIETHPVVSTEGWVAYASNSGGEDGAPLGDYDIWVAIPSGEGEDCDAWRTVNLTEALEGDELWPSWQVAEDPDGTFRHHTLVFSTADPGELPDLARIELVESADEGGIVEWDGDPADWSEPDLLTVSSDTAETQPAIGPGGVVAFTTTQDRPYDGSIRLLQLAEEPEEDPEEEPVDDPLETWYPWPEEPPESSEPTWGFNSDGLRPYLAYTTRDRDPYGDIGTARYRTDGMFERFGVTIGTTGLAETHPAWVDTFSDEDVEGAIVYTSRTVTQGMAVDSDRVLDADISDVLIGGGDRTRIRNETVGLNRVDEAGPDYSPDGSQVVYSRSTGLGPSAPTDNYPERQIWIANADGTDPRPLTEETGHTEGVRDRDPVWSPDGTRIAFVREPASGGASEVYVADLDGGEPIRVTPEVDFDAPGTQLDHKAWYDSDPDWDPEGDRLVLRRTTRDCCVIGRPAPGWAASAAPAREPLPARSETLSLVDDGLWVVPVQTNAVGTQVDICYDGCGPVTGRHPTWAPDGSAIAYVSRGAIWLGEIGTDEPGTFEIGRQQLTGFDFGEPTEAALVLSRADDPAWAPDSSEIAFSGQPIGQPDQRGIYRIPLDATGLEVVTDGRGPETEPSYQYVETADVGVTVEIAGSPATVGDPITATFSVVNNGPETASPVELVTGFSAGASATAVAPPVGCETDGTGCTFETLAPGDTQTYVVTFSHDSPVLGTATATVSSPLADSDLTNNSAEAPYEVVEKVTLVPRSDVAVLIALDETTGYVGGQRLAQVRVRNRGPQTAEGVTLTATWPAELVASAPVPGPDPLVPPLQATPACLPTGDPCAIGSLAPGALVVFEVVLATPTEGEHTIAAEVSSTTVDPVAANNAHSVELPVLLPSIRLVPAVARPGQVVMAYGENMPPDTEVALSWRAGVVIRPGPLKVAEDGTVRNSILIVRREKLGERTITATSETAEFSAVSGDGLVVLRTMSPPDLVGRG